MHAARRRRVCSRAAFTTSCSFQWEMRVNFPVLWELSYLKDSTHTHTHCPFRISTSSLWFSFSFGGNQTNTIKYSFKLASTPFTTVINSSHVWVLTAWARISLWFTNSQYLCDFHKTVQQLLLFVGKTCKLKTCTLCKFTPSALNVRYNIYREINSECNTIN